MISPRKALSYQQLLNDPFWNITEEGELTRQSNGGGNLMDDWREQPVYHKENRYYFKYFQTELSLHTLVMARFNRLPNRTEMIIHLDGDTSNNSFSNLQIVPKKNNSGRKSR